MGLLWPPLLCARPLPVRQQLRGKCPEEPPRAGAVGEACRPGSPDVANLENQAPSLAPQRASRIQSGLEEREVTCSAMPPPTRT